MAVTAEYRIEAKMGATADQVALFEDGTLDEMDAVTPAWDKEVNAVADFDAETDADNDLNDSTDAAHDGAVGLEFTFDDNNVMYGTMNATAVNNTSGIASFWFDKNDWALEDTKFSIFFQFYNGVPTSMWDGYFINNGGTLTLYIRYLIDGGALTAVGNVAIPAGYNNYKIMIAASTGVGNNDGYMRLYINNTLEISGTGHDNDLADWDFLQIGIRDTNSTAFGGSFYMDTILIDPVGAPMVDNLGAMNGNRGMSIPIMDNTPRYVSFTDPANETIITAECNFDLNTLTMANGEFFRIITGDDGALVFIVYLYYTDADGYQLFARTYDDAPAFVTTSIIPITDAEHHIRIVWVAKTGAGDGYLSFYIGDVLIETLSGIDNDTRNIDTIKFGATAELDAGTYGIIYFDDCKWGPWIDITSDVLEDIEGYWGMSDNEPLDLLADTGVMTLVLNNSDGLYLPSLTTALDEFDEGTPIRLVISYSGASYVRFYGTIDTITPEPGAFTANKVTIEVTDWLDYAATHPVINPALGEDKRGDEMITTILGDMPINPLVTDLDTGINTFPTVFDVVTTKTKVYTELSKIALSEIGPIYLIKDQIYGETLVFENAEARNGLRTPDVTIDNSMRSIEVEYGKNVINRFTNLAYPRRVDDTLVVLFSLAARQIIGSGQTITFRGNYSDPDGGGTEVSGFDMETPVIGTDYDIWTNQDGTGVDIKADLVVVVAKGTEGTTFTLTNGNAEIGWVWIQIRGYGIYTYNPIEHAVEDSDSVDAHGYETETLRQKYQQVLTRGSLAGAAILEQERQPRLKLNRVHFVANRSDSLMLAWLTQDIGNLCYIKEDGFEIDKYAYILGVAFTISPGGLMKFSWIVKGILSLALGLSLIACEFDTASHDGIDYGYLPQIANALPTRSFSFWVYTAGPSGQNVVVASFSDEAGTFIAIRTKVQYYQKGATWPGIWETASVVPVTTWTQIVCTRDSSDPANLPIIYVNGVNQAPLTEGSTQNGATVDETGTNFFIGNVKTATIDWDWSFSGIIKDVRVYDVILTQAEATSLAAGGNVTRGMVFQGPCVRTKELADFEDLALTTEKLIDNMFGCVGTPNNTVITRLIP